MVALVAKILENIELLKQIKQLESDMLVQKLASELQIPVYLDYELDYNFQFNSRSSHRTGGRG